MNDMSAEPGRAGRRREVRRRRAIRRLIVLGLCVGVAAALWFWVFPWVDKTFVNRPAL